MTTMVDGLNLQSLVASMLPCHVRYFSVCYSEAKALVPVASDKLSKWVIDWLIEYAIFLRGLAQQWRLRKKQNLAQR